MSKIDAAYLILSNGRVFEGKSFGAKGETCGEIVFTTGMVGYLETLTDPNYFGQIILQTFPLIGNYGVIPADFEKESIAAKAYIVKYPCQEPSNFRSEGSLDTFLNERGVIGLWSIDTRALTKIIRENGTLSGKITQNPPTDKDRQEVLTYVLKDAVGAVSSKQISRAGKGRVLALLDYGTKAGIAASFVKRGFEVLTFPHNSSADEILSFNPAGIVLSNGPGDPADPANAPIIECLQILIKSGIPIFGICLGHQLLAIANGYTAKKLKFGHRGANQPVKDLKTGRIYITSQNHGYTVEAPPDKASFINLNDGTNEGLDYGRSFSVQFHPGGRAGPLDTEFLFDRFVERMA